MKVLVIGKGGREHAIVRALTHSPSVNEVHAIPGSAGMGDSIFCHDIKTTDFNSILDLVQERAVDLVVIGPESEIALGLSDYLREKNILVFAPSQSAGHLETSKVFSKEFMQKAGVPTAEFVIVSSVLETLEKSQKFTPPYVLKADGLAAGKGVFICENKDELQKAAQQLFEEKILGSAGERALLEQYQEGWELSYLILTNGDDYKSLPLSQDHKRLNENNLGPNTGGMGVVGPLKINKDLMNQIHETILKPTVAQIKRDGFLYRGVLYVGIMVTEDGPSVLEYNARFGDPEAQVIMPLLDGDWGEVMFALAKGNLTEMKWKPLYASCIVLAAENYPENPVKNIPIQGPVNFQTAMSYFLHAGTSKNDQGEWVVNGGRVINAIGLGNNLKESLQCAYEQAGRISWPGMQIRRDIGQHISEV